MVMEEKSLRTRVQGILQRLKKVLNQVEGETTIEVEALVLVEEVGSVALEEDHISLT